MHVPEASQPRIAHIESSLRAENTQLADAASGVRRLAGAAQEIKVEVKQEAAPQIKEEPHE
jgi:hypothetical protein